MTAVEDAGWPHLVTVHHDRKVVSHYIQHPDFQGLVDGIFFFELPLEEEQLTEQVQLIDILPKEDVDEFYAKTENEEVNDDATNTAEE